MKELQYSLEVAEALRDNKAVVALESTIIAHGMPYPHNLETARAVEEIIRKEGATPATIAVIEGRICIGLSSQELEWIAKEKVGKLSRRDLPIALSRGESGATTVSATLICAQLAKIPLFVTGGIGGVHRGVSHTWDISADLQELATTNVSIVTAGAKAILDIPKTLEMLETLGITVLGYQTECFPAFYSRESGCSVDARIETPAEAAKIIIKKRELGMQGGVVIANPIPHHESLDQKLVELWIAEALEKSKEICGKEVTPFLLAYLVEKSGGRTLEANTALIKNNARLGAQIALHL